MHRRLLLFQLVSEPWQLASSHIPYQMIDLFDTVNHPEYLCYGGGFGPVSASVSSSILSIRRIWGVKAPL